MIITIGLGDKLVGVSAYDTDPSVKNLPKVGDYQRIDWEQISLLKPTQLFLQGRRDRLPPGIDEHCRQLGITANILQIDRLSDIYAAIDQIGKATGQTQKSDQARELLQKKLSQVGGPRVPAIILIEEGKSVAGRDNYLNDLLELAGGENVIQTNGYVNIDAEMASTLRPEVILILTMDRTTGDQKSMVISSDNWPAIRNKKIFTFSDNQSLLPGACVSRVYDFFNSSLHPVTGATTQP